MKMTELFQEIKVYDVVKNDMKEIKRYYPFNFENTSTKHHIYINESILHYRLSIVIDRKL